MFHSETEFKITYENIFAKSNINCSKLLKY